MRTLIVSATLLACSFTGAVSQGQEWARKMFDGLSFDFMGVARGSKIQHRFVLTNIYKEDVHIASVRSSCGCTTPEFNKDTLKTYEKGEIIATFNTGLFTGQRGATITVTFDKPYYAEVQLKVSGYIRTDVVLHPAGVEFGSLDTGTPAEQRIEIDYAGRGDWEITGIKSPSPYITAEATERKRDGSSVAYDLVVRIAKNAPVGYLKQQLILTTNDRRESQLPVDIEGQIVAPLTVSPASLFLGVLEPGQKVTKQLVVKSKKPFKIIDIDCDDDCFQFKNGDASKTVHLVPVTFVAGEQLGKVVRKIRIKTDLGEDMCAECAAYAQVTKPTATQTAESEDSTGKLQPEPRTTAQSRR